MTYVVVSSGHLRGLHGLGATPAPASVQAALQQASNLLDRLGDQRNRIAAENTSFKVVAGGGGVAFGPVGALVSLMAAIGVGEFNSRINATDTLLASVDNFVSNVFNRVEAQALDPNKDEQARLAAAQRLVTATTNILRAVGDTSPIGDLALDIKKTVVDIGKDTAKLLDPNAWNIPVWAYGLGAVVGLYYLSNIVTALKPKQ
jgi:hypothetical protein